MIPDSLEKWAVFDKKGSSIVKNGPFSLKNTAKLLKNAAFLLKKRAKPLSFVTFSNVFASKFNENEPNLNVFESFSLSFALIFSDFEPNLRKKRPKTPKKKPKLGKNEPKFPKKRLKLGKNEPKFHEKKLKFRKSAPNFRDICSKIEQKKLGSRGFFKLLVAKAGSSIRLVPFLVGGRTNSFEKRVG